MHGEGGAAPRHGVKREFASVLVDNHVIDYRQALSSTFARCFGSKKIIEYLWLNFLRNTATGIGNLDFDTIVDFSGRKPNFTLGIALWRRALDLVPDNDEVRAKLNIPADDSP